MTNEEIKAALLGQTVSKYDGWNGSSRTFVVRDTCIGDDYVNLYGEIGGNGDGSPYVPGVSLDKSIIGQFILTGKYISHQEIDHCPYDVIIEIHPSLEEQFQQRIDSIKADIKRLKNELKQAQTDYENYLVSSVRLEVIRNYNELKK